MKEKKDRDKDYRIVHEMLHEKEAFIANLRTARGL